jgi:hypothetical protein
MGQEFSVSNPFAKINILRIVKDHISTFKNYGESTISKFDVLFFFVGPLLVSLFLVFSLKAQLTSELANLLITVFSIFAGLLFNLQILMFDAIGKVSNIESLPANLNNQSSLTRRMSLLESVSFNISFEVLLCLSGVLLLATSTVFRESKIQYIFSMASFYVVISFSLTLAMVLKRVHGMLSDEIRTQKELLRNRKK